MEPLAGYKTYIACFGLIGLAIYQVSQGQFDTAFQTILAALAAYGLRSAVAKAEPAAFMAHAPDPDETMDFLDSTKD